MSIWLISILIVYAVIVFAIAVGETLNDTLDNLIGFKDIECIADVIGFMFSGPALMLACVFKMIGKGLTCKFRVRK